MLTKFSHRDVSSISEHNNEHRLVLFGKWIKKQIEIYHTLLPSSCGCAVEANSLLEDDSALLEKVLSDPYDLLSIS